MHPSKKILAVAISTVCAGCSSFDIDRSFLKSRTLEADERMLLVTDKGTRKKEANNNANQPPNNRVVCAEPSPDAMSALAASGALKGNFGSGEIEASGAFAKAIGELGERTPVIQLLRDDLYRACEAYMNGLLDDVDYYDILVFFDIYSATLLGIESLTHIPRPPVIVQTSANSDVTNKKESEGDGSKKSEETKTNSEVKSNSPTLGSVTETDQRSDKVAEKVFEILKDYHKSKATLFLLLEAKKLHEKKEISTQDYLKILTGIALPKGRTSDEKLR